MQIQARNGGIAGDMPLSKVHRASPSKDALPEVSVRNCTGFQDLPAISEWGSDSFTGGTRGIFGWTFGR